MKKAILAASAALLIAAPTLGLAQDDHHHDDGGHPGGGAPQYHQNAPAPHTAPPPQVQHPGFQGGYRPQPGQAGYPAQSGAYHGGPAFPGGQGGYRPQSGQPSYRQPGFPGAQAGGYRGFGPGGPVRSGGQGFAYGGRQFFRYRAAPYRFPGGYYGWANHSWRRGEWLPQVFIDQNYYINDWSDFGLWQPDYGYEWIRVGADAVLVNLNDGQVVDDVPGVYYY